MRHATPAELEDLHDARRKRSYPGRLRAVALLHLLAGRTVEDAANAVGSPPSTVRSWAAQWEGLRCLYCGGAVASELPAQCPGCEKQIVMRVDGQTRVEDLVRAAHQNGCRVEFVGNEGE